MNLTKKDYLSILLLAGICFLLYFLNLGGYKLIDVDEPRYAEAAREMLSSGNWITPYFNYELRFDKPVFFYWLIALSYIVFGVTEFAARFPSALLSTVLIFFTYYFGRKTVSNSFGLISSIILATSLEFIAIGRMSITDMALAVFICLTIYCGFLGSISENKKKLIWWILAWLFSGIAVLTKGPVGFILPAMIFGIYFILTGKLKENLKPSIIIPGLLTFLTVSVPWYYLIIKEHGMAFVNYFFIKHNFGRFADSGFKQHHYPFYFYIPVILIGTFPWVTYFISSLIKYCSLFYKKAKETFSGNNKFKLAIFKDLSINSQVILYSIVWFLTIFLFFSTSKAKLVTYVLSCFPAVAMLTGFIWNDFIKENKNEKIMKHSVRFFGIFCFILSLVAIFKFNMILPRDEKLVSSHSNIYLVAALTIIPALSLIFYIKKKKIMFFASKIALMITFLLVATNVVIPIVYNSGQKELLSYVEYTNKIPESKLATYILVKPSIIFYAQKKVPHYKWDNMDLLKKEVKTNEPLFLILRTKDMTNLDKEIKYFVVKKGVKYSLVSNKKPN